MLSPLLKVNPEGACKPILSAPLFFYHLIRRAYTLPLIAEMQGELPMPKYVIEREIPGAGAMSPETLQAVSQKSCGVLRNLGPEIQWVHSYVTADKVYCVYNAPNEELVREHASQGGFPANKISEVKSIIDPTTAEAK
jgi:hypothetical protein